MLAAMDSCFGHFRPHQHGIASTQAQFPNKSSNESAMLVGCSLKDKHILYAVFPIRD